MKVKSILLLVTASLCATASAQDFLFDIQDIQQLTVALEDAADAIPATGGTLAQFISVHNTTLNLGIEFVNAATDLESAPQNLTADAFAAVLATEPAIEKDLSAIVAKKSALTAFSSSGYSIELDLKFLNASLYTFSHYLIDNSPPDLEDQAISLKSKFGSILASAIAAFES